MRFIKNNAWTFCLVAVATLMSLCGTAHADIADVATTKAANAFVAVKQIMFIVGGFGLVGVAFSAIAGKISWKWFAGLAVGLAILAAAGSIVDYATSTGDGDGFAQGKLSDSLR